MPFLLKLSDDQKVDLLADLRRYWRNEGTSEADAALSLRILLHQLLSHASTDSDIQDLLD